MDALLRHGALFEGLSDDGRRRLAAIARRRALDPGQYLFLLGDNAADFFVLVRGKVDLCLPMKVRDVLKDVSVESVNAGQPLGWSALVKPYRFTLSARATEPSEVICLARHDLLNLFEGDLGVGYAFFTKVSEIVGVRLHTFQALWVRELQRTLESEAQRQAGGPAPA
jgi:CRP/FNR family cyclic AMP-dependent transcriptional regulator